MHIEHLFGVALAAAEIVYATAHVLVLRAPGHVPVSPLWSVVAAREAVVVPVGILALTFFYDHAAAPGLLATCAVFALISAVMLFRVAPVIIRGVPAPAVPAPAPGLGLLQRSAPSSYPPEITYYGEGATAETASLRPGRALDELRQQRRLTQVLWDVPAAVVTVARDGAIENKIGGALRSAGYPVELTGSSVPPDSEIGRVCADVLRGLARVPFEVRRNGRSFSIVASPWVSPSGRVRGVALVLLSGEDGAMTDEESAPVHYVESNKQRLA